LFHFFSRDTFFSDIDSVTISGTSTVPVFAPISGDTMMVLVSVSSETIVPELISILVVIFPVFSVLIASPVPVSILGVTPPELSMSSDSSDVPLPVTSSGIVIICEI